MIALEVNGVEYANFTSASAEIRLDALSNTFSFGAVATQAAPLPFTGGESCKVLVDGEVVVTGSIEVVKVNYSGDEHTISIQGRDKTGDLLDSNLDAISDIRAPISLKGIIERVILEIGADISVVDEASPELFNAAEDTFAPEPGENAFDFIESIARKRQVLLTSNGDGNIVITASVGTPSTGAIQKVIGADGNNVTTGSVSYDTTGRFGIYKMSSQMGLISLNNAGDISIGEIVDQSGTAPDEEIQKSRPGRQLVLVAEGSFSSDQDKLRAQWEANIRKARGKVYAATVQGHRTQGGDLWGINTLVPVEDDFAGISADMLVNTVAFTTDEESGDQTTLSLLVSNAYTLDLEEPKTEVIGLGL